MNQYEFLPKLIMAEEIEEDAMGGTCSGHGRDYRHPSRLVIHYIARDYFLTPKFSTNNFTSISHFNIYCEYNL
jgi:hypothetical protein